MRTMITAHAGAEDTKANTMESIRKLVVCGADAIEIDVRSHNGKLILSHDVPAEGEVYDTLETCFREVVKHAGLKVNVDLKEYDIIPAIAQTAQQCGILDRIMISGDMSAADLLYTHLHGIMVCYNESQMPKGVDMLACVSLAGCEILNVYYGLVTDEMYAAAPERLSLWTVNDETAIRKQLQAGVYNITTCCPVLALRLRDEIQGK